MVFGWVACGSYIETIVLNQPFLMTDSNYKDEKNASRETFINIQLIMNAL